MPPLIGFRQEKRANLMDTCLERRGEDLAVREEAQRGREASWGSWREIGDAMEARREAREQREREERWERTDREQGDPPGTARAREEMDRGDEWGR